MSSSAPPSTEIRPGGRGSGRIAYPAEDGVWTLKPLLSPSGPHATLETCAQRSLVDLTATFDSDLLRRKLWLLEPAPGLPQVIIRPDQPAETEEYFDTAVMLSKPFSVVTADSDGRHISYPAIWRFQVTSMIRSTHDTSQVGGSRHLQARQRQAADHLVVKTPISLSDLMTTCLQGHPPDLLDSMQGGPKMEFSWNSNTTDVYLGSTPMLNVRDTPLTASGMMTLNLVFAHPPRRRMQQGERETVLRQAEEQFNGVKVGFRRDEGKSGSAASEKVDDIEEQYGDAWMAADSGEELDDEVDYVKSEDDD